MIVGNIIVDGYNFVFFGFALWSLYAGIGILILSEIIVFITEMIIYHLLFKERKWLKPVPYAILANLASFILGWFILAGFCYDVCLSC